MKRFNLYFLSIFPDLFKSFFEHSIMKRAIQKGYVTINFIDVRNFSKGKHKQVDDFQYGGGNGMILMVEPIYKAIKNLKLKLNNELISILLSPQGEKWNQKKAREIIKKYNNILFISGNYEGFDERIRDFIDYEISIGDYILTGGELSSLVIANSLIRLIPNVIKKESIEIESFTNQGRLDHPVYTKPTQFLGKKVPDILLSGHHKNIDNWRIVQSLKKTIKKREDLIKKYPLNSFEKKLLNKK